MQAMAAPTRRELIDRALSGVEAWERRWGRVPGPAASAAEADVAALLDRYAARMEATLPFFHPSYAGQMLKAPHPVAVAAYLAAMIVNPNNHALDASQATSPMELEVIRALAAMFGLPAGALGHLTSSGTIANLEALWVARELAPGRAVVHSEAAHYTHGRMCQVLGVESRAVAAHPDGRIDIGAVAAECARGGVGCVVLTPGTTGLGAVDDIGAALSLRERFGVRLHVDAAYGGFFHLTDRGGQRLAGIEQADSITLDPHKGMFLPYGTGCLLAQDAAALRDAHEVHAQYLPPVSQDAELPDFSSYSPELTRDFRGLRLWLPLHLHGVRAFEEALDEKLDLARAVHDRLSRCTNLDVPWPPALSLVTFRPAQGTDEDTEELLQRIHASRRVWLSTAPINGKRYIRMCILSHRSTRERIAEAVEIITAAAS
jgi:glutamate/tyrosine decarboxylase-like PLP-dependent enzyme